MSSAAADRYSHLPGGEYVGGGLADLANGRETLSSLLLSIASGRLTAAGLPVAGGRWLEPELRLYRLLRETHGDDAHSQYNAHLRRLDSLCRALEAGVKKQG